MSTQTHPNNQQQNLDSSQIVVSTKYQSIQQNLEHLFNPFIRVVPEQDWSSIKAIWIPFLHHDYKTALQKSEKIMLVQSTTDKFGSIQGYLLARNENYIPYLTTFFNPALTQDEVIEQILQAQNTLLETQCIVTSLIDEKIIRKTMIGAAKSGMLISITTDYDNNIIDAYPIFHQEQL